MTSLQNKTAIVTGASSGIGAAVARLFAEEGANLILIGRRAEALEALTEAIGETGASALPVVGDVRDEETSIRAVALARDRFGGLDIAINNAGITGEMAPFADLSVEAWQETIDTNLTGAFLNARHQIPAMVDRGGGSIVFTGSFVGHTVGFPGMGAYAASKAGLIGMMQVIAAEFGPQGVRANAILPGGTDTPMGQAVADSPDVRAYVESLHGLKRIAQPREIAGTILHLASDQSTFVTGATILADGGLSISRP